MKEQFNQGKRRKGNKVYQRYTEAIRHLRKQAENLKGKEAKKDQLRDIQRKIKALQAQRRRLPSGDPFDGTYKRLVYCRYADDVRHVTQDEILLAEKGGSEDDDLRVISPTWRRKPKGKGACERRRKRVKALKRGPARPA